ncbi:glutamate-1-semialdehyde 2,1-aminomutase [Propionigenium maris DSM 9537]|uniref:Glutamate-1-semialdehyde 2,1-aminomutase n=1 Tax=Propionigenium maris DSM 9537 TaxID=1123000 RepID=A0A9W6GJP0_9FUSO|nr:glutamate-1-semialdehyde 2,1-aminomutase [Propionigenium maris]GLI54882.1 glutamate-1-semialdehyde 2,1-aminomutase [Propionigenium maris DSM 9537]
MIHNRSQEAFEKAQKFIPGGVNSPVRAFRSVERSYPIFIKKAKGNRLWDEDGNEYMDYLGSWGPMILGHNNERVLAAVKECLEDGSSFGLPTSMEVELAELIVNSVPSIEMVRLTTSGTEATMAAVRVARAYTKKNKILKFEGCYHGHSDSLLVKAGSGLLTEGYQDSNGITAGVTSDTLTLPFGDLDKVRELVAADKEIACIIVEPVPANMGLMKTAKEYLQGLREICDSEGIVLIFDEVISGFRLALGGAQEYYGIEADITTLGKIIGGGYPVGAFGGKREIMEMIAPLGDVYHAGTLSGNPISVRAGYETLTMLRDNPSIYTELEEKVDYLTGEIEKAAAEEGVDLVINKLGSLYTIYFTAAEKIENLEDVMATDTSKYITFFNTMLEEGIIVSPSKFEAHIMSIAHTKEDLERTIAAARKAFKVIAEQG